MESSEWFGGSQFGFTVWYDRCIAPSGKSCLLCDALTSPSCPAGFPREGRPRGKGREAYAETPIVLCRAFSLSTSTRLLWESRELGSGTAACCLKWLLCVPPLKHLQVYKKNTCCIKHRCHFSLRSQLAEQKSLTYQPVAEFSPALSLSRRRDSTLAACCACVCTSKSSGLRGACLEGQRVGMRTQVPLSFRRGFAVGCSHPNHWAAGAHQEHAGNMASPAQGWELELLGMLQESCRQALWLEKICIHLNAQHDLTAH